MTMFISSPAHAARTLAPTVLLIHGGPWRHVRDGYDARRIDLAAAGYTVLEPNFRGSTGAGSEWTNAGDREWGAAMQHDLEDALQWAIERGLADPGRVALVGASYGGYAALQMAATTHLPVRCAIAVAPLTDLAAFVATPPPYWESARPLLRRRIGDPSSAEDRARLDSLSPVNRASGIRVPVLLVHGFNDSRIPIAMTNRMLMALARERRQGLFAIFLDEGHEIVGTVNRSFLRRLTQDFLEEHVLGASSGAESPSVPPQVRLLRTPALTSQAPTC